MTKPTGPRRSWCFGEYYHTTDPVGCHCAEDLEPGSKHDVTAMTAKPEDLIRELRSEIGAGFTAMDQAADTIEELQAQNRRLRELARYAKSYGEYHLEKFYDGDPEGIAAGPRKLIDLATRALEDKP